MNNLMFWSAVFGRYWNDFSLDTKGQIIGGFIATFLGVYLSIYLNNRHERKKVLKEKEIFFKNALGFLGMELHLNEKVFQTLYDGLSAVPRVARTIQSDISMLAESSHDVRLVVFDSLVSSGAIYKVRENHELFNALHLAYFDLKTGIDLLPHVFDGVDDEDQDSINRLLNNAYKKTGSVLGKIQKAKELVKDELEKYGEVFAIE